MQSLTVCTMHSVYSGLCSAPWTLTISCECENSSLYFSRGGVTVRFNGNFVF